MSFGDDPVVGAPPPKGGYGTDPVAHEPEQSWGDVGEQALSNAIPSAKRALEGIVAPITDPAGTAKNLSELVAAISSKLEARDSPVPPGMGTGMADAPDQPIERGPQDEEARKNLEAPADAMGKYFAQRYGSIEGFKKALADDPIGVAMDIGTIGAGGEAIGGRAATLTKPLRMVDPIRQTGNTLKTAGKVAESVGSHTLGHLTGGGAEAIRTAAQSGFDKQEQFIKALFQEIPIEDSVKLAAKSIGNMRQQRNENYQTLMKGLKTAPEEISFDKIKQARIDFEDRGRFNGVPLYQTTPAIRAEVDGILDAWEKLPKDEFHTLAGFDALKKKLGSVLGNIGYDKRTDLAYVAGIKKAVSDSINEQAPIYSKVMKDYHQASDALEEIEKSLSLSDRPTYDSGVRKLLSAMRNNANTNHGNRLKMVEALEKAGAPGLKAQLAGSQMSSAMPRGMAGGNPMKTLLASIFEPGALAALPFESPKLVGQGLYKGGRVAGEVSDALRSTIIPDASTVPGKMVRRPGDVARVLRQMSVPEDAQ